MGDRPRSGAFSFGGSRAPLTPSVNAQRGALLMGGHRAAPEPFVDVEGMENARLGVVYLFSKIRPIPNIISVAVDGVLGIASQGMDGVGKGVTDGVKQIASTLGGVGEKIGGKEALGTAHQGAASSIAAFKKWAEDLLKKIVAEIKIKFREPKFIVGELKGIVMAFVRIFAKEAAPYVKGVMDMVKGLARATPLIINKIRIWMLGRDVELVEGHPSIMVDSLKRAMSISIFEGLYIAIKGAADIALTTVTAGAAAIAKIVIAFVEAAVKIVWRMFELFRIDEFCDWCRDAFARKDAPTAPHKDAAAFAKKYRKFAMQVPVIAALTLNSGICGDKMRFIKLFGAGGAMITQLQFDSGVAMIDKLKPFAGGLLRNMGVSFVISDNFVKNVVEMAKREPAAITPGQKFIRWANDFLTL